MPESRSKMGNLSVRRSLVWLGTRFIGVFLAIGGRTVIQTSGAADLGKYPLLIVFRCRYAICLKAHVLV